MTNRLILYVALGLAVFSWGHALYVKGVTVTGEPPPELPAATKDDGQPRYPEVWPVVCSGRVEAIDGEVDLHAQIAGPLTEVRVTEGDFVPKGAVVAVVEGAREIHELGIAEQSLETARARLKRVQAGNGKEEADEALFAARSADASLASEAANLERDKNLYIKRMLSREDYERRYHRVEELKKHRDSLQKRYQALKRGALPEEIEVARSEVAVAEARVRRAKVELEYRTVRAPISGLVSEVYLHAGDSISLEQPRAILQMIDTGRLRLRLEVDEMDVAFVKTGMEGTFAVRGDKRTGNVMTVQAIVPKYGPKRLFNPDTSIRLDTRVLHVLCVPTSNRVPLYPGQRVTATFTRTQVSRAEQVLVAERTLQPQPGDLGAQVGQYVLNNRKPRQRP